jgi:Rrf2 family protein
VPKKLDTLQLALYKTLKVLFVLFGAVMKLTRAGEYAVRCVLFVSGHKFGCVVSRREIASAMQIPQTFLSKIAQQLSRNGFIETVQGPKGGYRLLKIPEEITLLDVVEALDGEIFLNDCVVRPESCFRNSQCSVYLVWEKARDQLRATLREATFDKLLKNESCMHSIANDIEQKRSAVFNY